MEPDLVAGRSCGSCNVCCVVPTIRDPELQKPPGIRCVNSLADGSCAIYETRPGACRDFFCGWRRLDWVAAELRPDASGVYIRLSRDAGLTADPATCAFVITLLHADALKAPGLASAILAAAAAGMPAYLVVPGPPGHTSCRIPLAGELATAVDSGDDGAIVHRLAGLYRRALGQLGKTRPVVLESSPAAPSPRG